MTTKLPKVHSGMSTLVRPKFAPGMLLEHGDLELLPAYTRELSRMMFRSFFGCGVVCGLRVDADIHCGKVRVIVDCGLAIDCQGDPVYVPKKQIVEVSGECDDEVEGPLWVVICGTRKCCAPRASMCASDEDETPSAHTRERDAFEIRVLAKSMGCGCEGERPPAREPGTCKCVDPDIPCYQAHYAGKCGCGCEDGGCECCDCDCIVLARIDHVDDRVKPWKADHRVRRFVRPVLMRDPVVEEEDEERNATSTQSANSVQAGTGAVAAQAAAGTARKAVAKTARPARPAP